MTDLTREDAYHQADDMLRYVLSTQPNLLKERHPALSAGQDVALFVQGFIDQYADYLLKRPSS